MVRSSSRRQGAHAHLHRDAWKQQEGLESHEAKQLYVENLLRTLRNYSDRPQAMSMIAELEAYSGEVAEQVMSGTLADTASLRSSSVSQSPPPRPVRGAVHEPLSAHMEETTSSAARTDEAEHDLTERYPPRYAARDRHDDSRSASGSHSHETVTVSDMRSAGAGAGSASAGVSAPARGDIPRSRSDDRGVRAGAGAPARRPRPAGERRPMAPLPPQQSTATLVPNGRARAPPPSAPSKRSESDIAARSFVSARPSLHGPAERGAVRRTGGPMGRYAASSVGTGSSAGARAAVLRRAAAPPAAPPGELDSTLRSIQASLMALNERLNRAESSLPAKDDAARRTPAPGDAAGLAVRAAARAVSNALADLGGILGIGPRFAEAARAPSYDAWRGTGVPLWQRLIRAPLTFLSLVFRLLLDMTSVVVLLSVALAALRRVTGRGDPWIALRLLSRAGVRLSFLSSAANRRTAFRALLASALVGGVALESGRLPSG